MRAAIGRVFGVHTTTPAKTSKNDAKKQETPSAQSTLPLDKALGKGGTGNTVVDQIKKIFRRSNDVRQPAPATPATTHRSIPDPALSPGDSKSGPGTVVYDEKAVASEVIKAIPGMPGELATLIGDYAKTTREIQYQMTGQTYVVPEQCTQYLDKTELNQSLASPIRVYIPAPHPTAKEAPEEALGEAFVLGRGPRSPGAVMLFALKPPPKSLMSFGSPSPGYRVWKGGYVWDTSAHILTSTVPVMRYDATQADSESRRIQASLGTGKDHDLLALLPVLTAP